MPLQFSEEDWAKAFSQPTEPQEPQAMQPPPGLWEQAKELGGEALDAATWTGRQINLGLGEAMHFLGSPSSAPFSEQAVGAYVPGSLEERTWQDIAFGGIPAMLRGRAGAAVAPFAKPVVRTGAQMAVDPLTYGGLGLLGRAGPVGKVAHGVLGALFAGQMGTAGIEEGKKAWDNIQANGFSPEAIEQSVQSLIDLGFAGLGAKGTLGEIRQLGRPTTPVKPSTEGALAKAASDQLQPPPNAPWAQDAKTEWVNPQTDATMKGIADLALQEATGHIASKVQDPSRIPMEMPDLPTEVIFSDTTLDGADISRANGGAWQGKIYLTTLGRARLMQSGDIGGLSAEIRRLVAHEVAHVVTGGDRPGAPMRDIITGEPVTVADARTGMEIPTSPEPHAFDDRLDDNVREYNQYFQEQEIHDALKQSQALNEQAQIIAGQRRLEGQIQPRSAQTSTAGSYGRQFLETAQPLAGAERLNLDLEASTRPEIQAIQVDTGEVMPPPAEAMQAPPGVAFAGERPAPRPPAGPITARAREEGVGAKAPSFWQRLLGLRDRAEAATPVERPYTKALLGKRVEAPPSPPQKAFERMRDWAYGVDRRGTTKGSPVFQGKDAVSGLEWLKNDLDAQRAKGTRLGAYIVDTLKLKPGLLASVQQGLAQERLKAKNAGTPVPDHVVKGLEIIDHLRRNLGVTRLLGEGRRMERGRAENLLPGLTRRAEGETPEAKADRLLAKTQEFFERKANRESNAEGMASTYLNRVKGLKHLTPKSQEWVQAVKEVNDMAARLMSPEVWDHLKPNRRNTVKEVSIALHDDISELFAKQMAPPPKGKPALAGADVPKRPEETLAARPERLLPRGGYPRIIPERTALETAVQERMKARAPELGLGEPKPLVAGKPEPKKPSTAAPLAEVKAKKGRPKAAEVEERYRLKEFEEKKKDIYAGKIKPAPKGVSKLTKAQEAFQKEELAKPHEPVTGEVTEAQLRARQEAREEKRQAAGPVGDMINIRPAELGDALRRTLPEREFKLKEEYTPAEKEALKGEMRILPREVSQDKAVETVRALLFGDKPERVLAGVNAADANAYTTLLNNILSKIKSLSSGKAFTLNLAEVKKLGFSARMSGLVEAHFRDIARRLGKGEFHNGIEALEQLAKDLRGSIRESGFRKEAGGPLGKAVDLDRLAQDLEKSTRLPSAARGGPRLRAVPLQIPWGTRSSRMEHFKDWLQRDSSQPKISELLTTKKNMLVAIKEKLGRLPKDIEDFIIPGEMIGKRRYFSAIQTIMGWEQNRINRLEAAVQYYDGLGKKARADKIQKLLDSYRPTTLAHKLVNEVVQREGSITVRNRLGTESQQQLLSTTRSERKFGTALEHPMLQAAGGKVAGTKIPDLLNLEGAKRAFKGAKRPGVGPEVETEIQQAMEKAISAKEEKAIQEHVAEELAGLEEFIPEVAGGIKVSKVGTGKYTGVTRKDVVPGALYEPRIQAPRTGMKPGRTIKAMEEAREEGAHPEPIELSSETRAFLESVPAKDIPSLAASVGGRVLSSGERVPLRTAIASLVDRWVDADKIRADEANNAIEYLRGKRTTFEQRTGRGSAGLRRSLEAKLYPKGRPALAGGDVARRALEMREADKREFRRPAESAKTAWSWVKTAGSWLNVTRPLKTAIDVSNPLRNTWQLSSDQITRDVGRLFGVGKVKSDRTFLGNVLDSVKAFGEGKHKELDAQLKADPYFKAANSLGVNFIFEGQRKAEGWIGKEQLDKVVNHISKIPGVGQAKWLIDGSERAYTYYQNKAMRDAFKYSMDWLDSYEGTGKGKVTLETIKNVVNHINNAGSRGKTFEDPKMKEAIGYVLYSAQMNASRIRMLGNAISGFQTMKDLPSRRYAQMQTLRAITGAVGVVGMVYSLAKLTGQQPTIEKDPRSTDFGKVAMGDITFDGWGGNQQFIRASAQILTRRQKERSTGLIKPRSVTDTIGRFIQSKMGPGASAVLSALEGRNTSGAPTDFKKNPTGAAAQTIYDALMPMSVDDTIQIWKERPEVSWLIPLMLLGEGVSEGQGAKEAWLGSDRALRAKDVNVMRALRETGVTGPRLGRKVTIPGRDVFGRRQYYNLSPDEQAEFEAKYMPLVTDLLNKFITTEAYQKLPVDARRKRLFRYVHALNIRYGAATRLKSQYRNLAKAGLLKASNVTPEGEED